MKKKIKSFTDLIAWQKGHELVLVVYELTGRFPKQEVYVLTGQMRRGMSNLKIFLIFLATGYWLLATAAVSAAAPTSLSLSPPLLEAVVKPGRAITQAYRVANLGSSDLYLRARVVPFTPAGQQGLVKLEPLFGKSKSFLFSLQNADLGLGETFFLPAGDSRQLVLSIATPEEAADTDGYFTFLLEQSEEGEFVVPASGATARFKIGSNILLTVSRDGSLRFKGGIADFAARPGWSDVFTPVKLVLTAENTGRSFFQTKGEIKILDMFGREKKVLDLRPDNVLAGSRRRLSCLPAGEESGCSFSSLVPGRYRAVARFSPGGLLDEERPAGAPKAVYTRTVYFWRLPIKLGLALLIAAAAIVFGGRMIFVKNKH